MDQPSNISCFFLTTFRNTIYMVNHKFNLFKKKQSLDFNFYLNIESNVNSKIGFKVTKSGIVTLNILTMIAILATILSFILKRQRKNKEMKRYQNKKFKENT